MDGRTYSSFLSSDKESYESLSRDEEVPVKGSGSKSWSWGLKRGARFAATNDQLLIKLQVVRCRALQGWVTRAIWDCLLEEFRRVKANCVLHNFMRMDTRTRRGSAARRRVPEEKSGALQDVSRMGFNNAARGNLCAGDLHLLLLR